MKDRFHCNCSSKNYSLHQSILNQDFQKAHQIIESGVDLNSKDKNGNTPLHLLAEAGNVELSSLLIKFGAKLDVQNIGKNIIKNHYLNDTLSQGLLQVCGTPLHIAVVFNHPNIVKLLINSGASVNIFNSIGFTPIKYANSKKIIKILSCAGADLEKLDDLKYRKIASKAKSKALILEVKKNSLTKTKKIMKFGTKLDCQDKFGNTILHYAVLNKNKIMILELFPLILSFADSRNIISKKNNQNFTPLEIAVSEGFNEIVLLFLSIAYISKSDVIYNSLESLSKFFKDTLSNYL